MARIGSFCTTVAASRRSWRNISSVDCDVRSPPFPFSGGSVSSVEVPLFVDVTDNGGDDDDLSRRIVLFRLEISNDLMLP